MKFFNTKDPSYKVSLREAVVKGLAPGNGLFMPEQIDPLPGSFFSKSRELSIHEIAFEMALPFLKEDFTKQEIQDIVHQALSFDCELHEVEENIFSLELFHGPTLAFKDFGAQFMGQVLRLIAGKLDRVINVLVATSGDTGSAVAHGFFRVPGINVIILYPEGRVSELQEKQFASLGENIRAVKIRGSFDDCQRLVKESLQDDELGNKLNLTSANSINIARLIPQSFYYVYGWSRLPKQEPAAFAVPSGNFGNLTAGLIAKRMGLPVRQFVACTNINDIVPAYLETGLYNPRESKSTISNAMDVGNPSNF